MSAAETGEYLAEFIDGPLEGEFERRALVGGASEERLARVAAVDGLESLFWYDRVDQVDGDEGIHARFRFDPGDSDPVEFDPDDNE
ncbi:hypothetical protein [Agromyces sp. LHK192]|uniref:hypothetical protein n=1 Tax=Agromyces sp. LHK192 TaxID=2498704 RepID=UPI000FD805AD|nr:hypothetical protein [Agromyces sp. LHK192]